MIEIPLTILLVVLFLIIPLLIYNFLVFPNLDAVVQNVTWYKYDANSQHFIYWLGFWTIVLFGSRSVKTKEKVVVEKYHDNS